MNFAADSIQGVLFLAPSQHQDDASKLWDILFPNDLPDGFQRATASSPALNSSAHGERNGYLLTINAQVGRIDVIMNQRPQSQPSPAGPPRIVEIGDATTKVADYLKRLAARSKVFRAAIVLDLAKTVQTGSENSEMLKILPGFPFPANVSDLSLQFNSRKSFDFSQDFEMNRLCIWNSGKIGFVHGPTINPNNMVLMASFVGFKVDVNSAPQAPLPPDNIDRAIDELSSEAIQIASEGVERLKS